MPTPIWGVMGGAQSLVSWWGYHCGGVGGRPPKWKTLLMDLKANMVSHSLRMFVKSDQINNLW